MSVSWTVAYSILSNLASIFDHIFEIDALVLQDSNGNQYSCTGLTVSTSGNTITIKGEFTPTEDMCIIGIGVKATFYDLKINARSQIWLIWVGLSAPGYKASSGTGIWLKKGVTYTIEIVDTFQLPTSVTVPAPTGTCSGTTGQPYT